MIRKVVFHIDDPDIWQEALANVENLLAYQQDHANEFTLKIVVSANGAGVEGYADPTVQETISQLKDLVTFHACNNSLNRATGISAKDLPDGVLVVPVGVYDLLSLENEGYAYIKP